MAQIEVTEKEGFFSKVKKGAKKVGSTVYKGAKKAAPVVAGVAIGVAGTCVYAVSQYGKNGGSEPSEESSDSDTMETTVSDPETEN